MKHRLLAIVLLVVLLLAIYPVVAQNETPTSEAEATPVATETATPEVTLEPTLVPTAEATEEPDGGPIIVDQVSFRLGTLGIIFTVVMLLVGGGGVGYVWGYIRGSKEAKDNLELAFKSTSPETQEYITGLLGRLATAWNTIDSLARQVIKLGGEVTDGLPNTGDAQSQ